MPKSPRDILRIRKPLTDSQKKVVAEYLDVLDAWLDANYVDGSVVTWSADDPSRLDPDVLRKIRRQYIGVGWHVLIQPGPPPVLFFATMNLMGRGTQ